MKQRRLPEFDYPDVGKPRRELVTADVGDERGESLCAVVLPGQRELFTAERELDGQIEAALSSGDFEDARRYRDALVALEGPSTRTRDLGVLDAIGRAGFWHRPLPVVLHDWLMLEPELAAPPNLRRLICDGGLSRLLDGHGPTELVRAAPGMLASVTNRLCAAVGADEGIPDDAATLLRDALLVGCDPARYAHDPVRQVSRVESPAPLPRR